MSAANPILVVGIATVDAIAQTVDALPSPGGLAGFDRLTLTTGGCAVNVALALARLDVKCDLVVRVGADLLGDFVVRELRRGGVAADPVVRDPSTPTSFSFVAVRGDGERSFLHFRGTNALLCRADVPATLLTSRSIVFVAGAMLMAALDGEPTAALLREARAAGATTMLDTVFASSAPTDEWRRLILPALPHCDCFVPSYAESRAITGLDDPAAAARALRQAGAREVVIKLAERGAFCIDAAGRESLVPAFAVEQVVDSTGAGDCWCAGFLAARLAGHALTDAVRVGHAVAAFGIRCAGATTGVPSWDEACRLAKAAGRSAAASSTSENAHG